MLKYIRHNLTNCCAVFLLVFLSFNRRFLDSFFFFDTLYMAEMKSRRVVFSAA